MLHCFRRCFTITLLCLCSAAAFAQPADQNSPPPLIEELLTADSLGFVAGVTLGGGAKPGVLLKATFEF